ncbi:matrixin family metalloprotease [Prosthecobacter sp.]|uniref:matrixin family metalloprotease n=1 Tax=Prosthecobacter sp. TaxID=1965333 RepID=UPI0037850875
MPRLLIFLLLALWSLPVHSHEPFPVLTLKVRAHLMQSIANPRLQTTLTEKEVNAILDEVNVIWSQAGIRFELEGTSTLQALEVPAKRWYIKDRNWVKTAIPTDKFSPTAIDVCFVKDMGPNGFFYGEPVVVCENPEFHRVSGGTENIVARVTAHELGHVLHLQHRQERDSLMASARNGTALNRQEIMDARKRALEISGQTLQP